MKGRIIATTIIWISFVIIVSILFTSPVGPVARLHDDTLLGMLLVLAAASSLSTMSVWHGQHDDTRDEPRFAKAKRAQRPYTGRVEQMIDALDDDEIYELEALLLDRDRQAERFRSRS